MPNIFSIVVNIDFSFMDEGLPGDEKALNMFVSGEPNILFEARGGVRMTLLFAEIISWHSSTTERFRTELSEEARLRVPTDGASEDVLRFLLLVLLLPLAGMGIETSVNCKPISRDRGNESV
mmetsp:Transcript_27745/g.41136  ORF Transcript_27745/g.41136 Transcript_27745/m.41136 type:complete len:122 (+) Transcript_27745:814-1179(+)